MKVEEGMVRVVVWVESIKSETRSVIGKEELTIKNG